MFQVKALAAASTLTCVITSLDAADGKLREDLRIKKKFTYNKDEQYHVSLDWSTSLLCLILVLACMRSNSDDYY